MIMTYNGRELGAETLIRDLLKSRDKQIKTNISLKKKLSICLSSINFDNDTKEEIKTEDTELETIQKDIRELKGKFNNNSFLTSRDLNQSEDEIKKQIRDLEKVVVSLCNIINNIQETTTKTIDKVENNTLPKKQKEVLNYLKKGYNVKKISKELNVSLTCVYEHIKKLKEKDYY